MSTEPNKSEFLPRLRYPKFPAEDAKGEFLPRVRVPKIPDEPAPLQPESPFIRAMEGNYQPCDYPEDASYENGNYVTKCQCGTEFMGHKRRVLCKMCAESPQPEPQQSAVEWNAEKWHDVITRDPRRATSAAHHLSIECGELMEDVANLRAQLAAEQAEAGRLREETTKLMRIADNYSHRVVEPRIVQMFENIEDAARAALKEGQP